MIELVVLGAIIVGGIVLLRRRKLPEVTPTEPEPVEGYVAQNYPTVQTVTDHAPAALPTSEPAAPEQGTIKIQTGRDRHTQWRSKVIFQGVEYEVNDKANEVLRFNVPPGEYTVEFGEAYHPIVEYTPPSPVTHNVRAGQTVLFFGKYMHISEASSPCGYKGIITGDRAAVSGITVYAWWPMQRNQYGAPLYPWGSTAEQGFKPEYFYTTVTDPDGAFYFRDIPIPPTPPLSDPYYCIGFIHPSGYKGGGERQFKTIAGFLNVVEWGISVKSEVTPEQTIAEAQTRIRRFMKLGGL